MQRKAGAFPLLSRKIENTIMPLFRKQKRYCDICVFLTRQQTTVTEDTFWNIREDAEEYQRSGYLTVLEMLSEVVRQAPSTIISEVSTHN